MNIGEELIVPDLKHVKFIAEDDCIEDSARVGSKRPAMEMAEVGSGYVVSIIVGDAVEGFWRGVPNRAKEVGNVVSM